MRVGCFGELTLLLTTDERLCALNARHRGKPKPTNVLAFPAGRNAAGYLGDIAIAYGVAAGEAAESGKPLDGHAAHLVVHGLLHLVGYDHQTVREARRMEGLEVAILHEMGIADPYARSIAAE
jgi:probable rRNA maturation factor